MWSPGRLLSGPLYGSGPAWGLALREAGRLTVVHWCAGWLACLVLGVEDTSSCFCFLRLCGGWGLVGALAVCGGGMLSGFWGSAPWLPGLCSAALCGWWGVGVGGLVVNCIVDASILLFVFCDNCFVVVFCCLLF